MKNKKSTLCVYFGDSQTFRRNISIPFSASRNKKILKPAGAGSAHVSVTFSFDLLFCPED
jgi:hypothetical protein